MITFIKNFLLSLRIGMMYSDSPLGNKIKTNPIGKFLFIGVYMFPAVLLCENIYGVYTNYIYIILKDYPLFHNFLIDLAFLNTIFFFIIQIKGFKDRKLFLPKKVEERVKRGDLELIPVAVKAGFGLDFCAKCATVVLAFGNGILLMDYIAEAANRTPPGKAFIHKIATYFNVAGPDGTLQPRQPLVDPSVPPTGETSEFIKVIPKDKN